MLQPRISVIIPTRDRAHYLGQALDSVFAQTLAPSEIIVVDDGSTDDTRAVLAPLIKEDKIRYFFQEQAGVSAARNKGISCATSPFIAFLDSDDIFLPAKLEKQMQVFEKQPDLGFVHCLFSKFDDKGQDLGIRDTSRFSGVIYPAILQEWSVLMAMPCMLARTEVIKEVGAFDEDMIWAEDMDLWRRISRRYAVGIVRDVLVRVRVHPVSISHEHRGEISGFKHYLTKAFEDDPDLSWTFKHRAMGKMYANLGQNLLGQGDNEQMQLVRRLEVKALIYWPFEFGTIVSWLASFLPLGIRRSLADASRRRRYSRQGSKL